MVQDGNTAAATCIGVKTNRNDQASELATRQSKLCSFTANSQNKSVVFYNDILTEGFVIQDSQLRESKPRCTLVLATNRTLNRFWL